jgi:2-oxoisovalerate dehydrogenase E1 component
MRAEIVREVEEAYERASAAAQPPVDQVIAHLYADEQPVPPLPTSLQRALSAASPITMVQAIVETLRATLSVYLHVMMFGEDIEDPKGGVFGLTHGLSTAFPGRVVNSPLAEATIVGTAVGLAACGRLPIFELQFVDFAGPAFGQLVNQVATLRWRTAGDQECPVVLLAPCGAYLPAGGMWHSQTNEGFWCHIPGLRVCVPSTPADAAGMLWTAIHMGDPVLYLIPKHLFRKRMPVDELELSAAGRCAVRREGTDVTLVAWGNCTELAAECAETAQQEGVSVEVLDLRWLNPCDWKGIQASLEKTGRLVVVHEDSRTGGFGDTVVAEMTARAERWNLFLAPPQIVARTDTPVPFAPVLEYAALPDKARVMSAIREVMR